MRRVCIHLDGVRAAGRLIRVVSEAREKQHHDASSAQRLREIEQVLAKLYNGFAERKRSEISKQLNDVFVLAAEGHREARNGRAPKNAFAQVLAAQSEHPWHEWIEGAQASL